MVGKLDQDEDLVWVTLKVAEDMWTTYWTKQIHWLQVNQLNNIYSGYKVDHDNQGGKEEVKRKEDYELVGDNRGDC